MDEGFEAGGLGEGDHVISGAGEFEDAVGDPSFESLTPVPGAFFPIKIGRKGGYLINNIIT